MVTGAHGHSAHLIFQCFFHGRHCSSSSELTAAPPVLNPVYSCRGGRSKEDPGPLRGGGRSPAEGGWILILQQSEWFRALCQSTPKQKKSAVGALKKQRSPAKQSAPTQQHQPPPSSSSAPQPADRDEEEKEEEEPVTRPRPPQEEEEEEAGKEEREEVATQSVKKKEEEEEKKEGETVMPSVQIKPEPEEMECTIAGCEDFRLDTRCSDHRAPESTSSFGDFTKSCGFNLSSREKRKRGEGKKTQKRMAKYEREWVEIKPARDERLKWEEHRVWLL
ncbi:hypothetical protein FQN60_000448 [Etheostoma spectabile]|uniref:Uncharacterized protein n=1 Tax=Etheostoma spectabile TaxID=54343 RepID=A0A5J5CWA9_9PERO|nr:hypothetical protein FQN60_000448 [Etheostoma spectabile]